MVAAPAIAASTKADCPSCTTATIELQLLDETLSFLDVGGKLALALVGTWCSKRSFPALEPPEFRVTPSTPWVTSLLDKVAACPSFESISSQN
jgi:hypothetical protein